MKPFDAAKIVIKANPYMIPIGYWEVPEGYLIRMKIFKNHKGALIPPLYIVKPNGEWYGTNPMQLSNMPSESSMKKFKV